MRGGWHGPSDRQPGPVVLQWPLLCLITAGPLLSVSSDEATRPESHEQHPAASKCKGWAMDIPRATVPCTTRQHRRTGTSPLFRRRARRSKVVIVAADRHSAACGQCGQVSSVPGGMEICRVAARGCGCAPSPGPSPFPSYVARDWHRAQDENRDTRFELSDFCLSIYCQQKGPLKK